MGQQEWKGTREYGLFQAGSLTLTLIPPSPHDRSSPASHSDLISLHSLPCSPSTALPASFLKEKQFPSCLWVFALAVFFAGNNIHPVLSMAHSSSFKSQLSRYLLREFITVALPKMVLTPRHSLRCHPSLCPNIAPKII